jgi:hypothetical protein
MRDAVRKGPKDLKTASLMIVYTLSSAMGCGPAEIQKLPLSYVMDLMQLHGAIEELKAEEMDKAMKESKSKMKKR